MYDARPIHIDHRWANRAAGSDDVSPHVRNVARSAERAAFELATQLGQLSDARDAVRPIQRSPEPEVLALTPEQAANALAISRTALYGLLRDNRLESVKIGGCRRIPAAALKRYLAELPPHPQD